MSKGIKCVKCKASPPYVLLNEQHSGGGIQFEQIDGGEIGRGYMFEPSSIDGVFAHCTQCNHGWTLRGINSIGDLRERLESR